MPESTEKSTHDLLRSAARRMLRPLARVFLRRGVPVGEVIEILKKAFVDVALEEFGTGGRASSLSRVAVLTGLTRKDVSRLARLDADVGADPQLRYNRAARVLTGWVRDRRYRNDRGRPATLVFDKARGPSFSDLVRRYSGDMTPRAMLEELLRVGSVTELRDGRIRLAKRAYVPSQGEGEKITILGTDVAELIATIDHNIEQPDEAFFQRKVAYDNLPARALPAIRKRAEVRAQALLEELDRAMARVDRDSAADPDPDETDRHRAVLGIYYLEEEVPPPADEGD